jgi:hypothetical protein
MMTESTAAKRGRLTKNREKFMAVVLGGAPQVRRDRIRKRG